MDTVTIGRRGFLKTMGALGALSVAGVGLTGAGKEAFAEDVAFPKPAQGQPIEASVDVKTGSVTVNEDVIVRYSACLGCYCCCGNRVHMDRETGRVFSTGGNPYHPNSAYPPLKFEDPLDEAYLSMSYAPGKGNLTRGTTCARGHATWDAYNQPDRVTTPLKRAGKRGEGKWKPISWDQLIKEVTEGGKLFAEIGEDTEIMGFKELHDTVTPMNPDQPDLGPVSNQFVLLGGRGDGRGLGGRITGAYGSINAYGHSSTCGGAQSVGAAFTEKRTSSVDSDLDYAEYVLWMGTFPGASGNSFQGISKRSAVRLQSGEMKMDVLDPVLCGGSVTPTMPGINWVPIKPTTNAAFSSAIVQWMIDNKAYNEQFVQYPNFQAAFDGGYASFCNATHLVIVDEGHENNRKLMRAAEAGLSVPDEKDKDGKDVVFYAVIDKETGEPALHTGCTQAALDFEGEVNGVKVRTAFSMMKEAVYEKSLEEYSEICGVPVEEIERIAREFTSHGTKASTRVMGGTALANGVDACFAMRVLNAMVGSNMMSGGAGPHYCGPKTTGDGARYKLSVIPDKPDVSTKNATMIGRNGKAWTKTKEYENRVAAGEKDPKPKLPWFPTANSADNQALMSIVNQYPYQAKILLSWMKASLESTPGAMRDELIEKLCDTSVVPLHITCDVVIGEDAQISDYIVPDTNPYESFGLSTQEGWAGWGTMVRWRVKEPGSIKLDDGRYASFETFCADIAKACDLPGFNEDALVAVDGTKHPFTDACDFFLKAVANVAYDTEPVEDISEQDMKLQGLDQLPESWKKAVTAEEWPKVLRVLSRGGRFEPIDGSVDEKGRNAYGLSEFQTYIYSEPRATAKNQFSGTFPKGTLAYTPQTLADGRELTEAYSATEFPFLSANHKPRFRSATTLGNSPIMQDLCDHNYLELNRDDAAELGIADGDTVRITDPSGAVMEGEAMVRAGIARGSFGVAFGYGHRAYGAQDVEIDGKLTKGNPANGAGVHLETMLDPTFEGLIYPLADPEASVPARSGCMFKIEKA